MSLPMSRDETREMVVGKIGNRVLRATEFIRWKRQGEEARRFLSRRVLNPTPLKKDGGIHFQ